MPACLLGLRRSRLRCLGVGRRLPRHSSFVGISKAGAGLGGGGDGVAVELAMCSVVLDCSIAATDDRSTVGGSLRLGTAAGRAGHGVSAQWVQWRLYRLLEAGTVAILGTRPRSPPDDSSSGWVGWAQDIRLGPADSDMA